MWRWIKPPKVYKRGKHQYFRRGKKADYPHLKYYSRIWFFGNNLRKFPFTYYEFDKDRICLIKIGTEEMDIWHKKIKESQDGIHALTHFPKIGWKLYASNISVSHAWGFDYFVKIEYHNRMLGDEHYLDSKNLTETEKRFDKNHEGIYEIIVAKNFRSEEVARDWKKEMESYTEIDQIGTKLHHDTKYRL